MTDYLAYRAHQEDGRVMSRLETLAPQPLGVGQVRVAVQWSGINYKDALAATGAGKIMKRFPLVVGIDLAGVVSESADPRYVVGEPVIVVGCGIGEESDGGFAEQAVVHGDWIVRCPAGLSLRDAMAIGTAGFTAAMGIQRLEDNGLTPSAGPVLVNGATGGVGSLGLNMLAGAGYRVTAWTGKADAADWLRGLGAAEVMLASSLPEKVRPLEKALWAGAIDNLGGAPLAWLCATMQPLGSIASIGLASSHELHTTVMPFILRGVNLLGINSTYCPVPLREKVWARLGGDLKPSGLATIAQREVGLRELPTVFEDYLQGRVTGRTLVRVGT
ncbi:acrylyl-CoA reductase family protein [Inhella gelatinilytica]|uniref:Acryloyl-CoA reductase n=1 Tax=Inhella gelatinilytica TaxID=2795030 RepID=A0A931NDI3_9BURK|nr:acryloyl-CoA reductase [Inhella gelatinilytica]MBH9551481.1 acryloyl-CoA reductase [Inhella gelatinilytica]